MGKASQGVGGGDSHEEGQASQDSKEGYSDHGEEELGGK